MKRIIILLISIIITANISKGQINWRLYSQSYPEGVTNRPSNVGIIVAETAPNNSFWAGNNNTVFENHLQNDTPFIISRWHSSLVAITSYDTSKAHFFLHGVNKNNAAKYEYRVTLYNGKTIVPWRSINRFTNAKDMAGAGMPQMAYLGGYWAKYDWIIVDVRQKDIGQIITTGVVAWKPIQPNVSQVYTANQLNAFLKKLQHPWAGDTLANPKNTHPDNHFGANENNLVFYISNADIYSRKQLQYELKRNNETIQRWKANDFDNNFVWLKDLKPGQYLLKMRFSAQPEHVAKYSFTIKTPWYDSIAFKIVMGVLVAATMGFILFLMLHVKQREKAELELAKKTKLQLELKAIHAQLNPHFVFNALNSIQGLINKQDIKGANNYLTDFASLMRETLNISNKENIPLKQEITTLDTYLKLEQLRFGFNYEITVDENINVYEFEIPSLLLQPLVENAVKHGVSGLQDKGIVSIAFANQNSDMLVTISDNGKGFTVNNNPGGFGLRLTQDRIKLLNDFAKEQAITFEIKANHPAGTRIELVFKNWFL